MNDTKESAAGGRLPDGGDTKRDAQHGRTDLNLAERLRGAQQSLLRRPRLSIRLRLVASLALCFLLCCAFSLGSFNILRNLRVKSHLLQTIERLDDHVLRVRARADEGILSSDDLEGLLEREKEAEDLLRKGVGAQQVDRDVLATLSRHADACRRLLAAAKNGNARAGLGALVPTEAAELRQLGTDASRLLEATIRRERVAVDGMLRIAETGPLILLGVLLVLFGVITFFFTKALVAPIDRFKGYTSRIAGGDFSFIRPARSYRDEFSDLAVAVNQMLAELRAQQNRVVKGAKLAAVGTLTSGIAHELNNPLNNISITTEALMEGLTTLNDEEKWRHLQDIYFETERASEIVKSLLDFTRKEKPEMVALDLAEVLQSTLRLAQNEMTINNVSLASDIPPDLPRVRGAANQLRQVFLNLLLNAIQSMPGGGTLSVSANTHDADKVCAEIRDEGIGISPDVLPRIFDPFFTTKEPGKGTGLGLSVSLGIIRKFGGDIQVASEPGKGTTVHVCLPKAEET
jgi:two-component system NtrC family sensor kinase